MMREIRKNVLNQVQVNRSKARQTIHWAAAIVAGLFVCSAQAANTVNSYTGTASASAGVGSNWSLGHIPNVVTEDAVFSLGTSTGIHALSALNLTAGSLDNTLGSGTTSLRNDTAGATDSTITLGGIGNLGNSVSGNAVDLFFVSAGGTFNIIGANGGGGTGVLNLVLGQSGNFNVAGTSTISSIISDGGSGFGFTKSSAGTLTLSGANTYTGNTGVAMGNTTGLNTASILNLSFAANQTNIINSASNSSALLLGGSLASNATTVLGGGQLTLTGVATSTNTQRFNGMTVGTGGNNIVFANNATANTIALNVGAITRTVGGTLHITQPTGTVSATNGVQTTSGTASTILTDANGTAFATVGGTAAAAGDWAAKDATNGFIVGGSTLGGFYAAANSTAAFTAVGATGNADITGNVTATAGTSVGSLRMNGATLTLNLGGGTTTIGTGGVLFGSSTNQTINTGTIRAGTGKELVFINTHTGTPQLNAVIADSTSGQSSVTYRALQLTSGNGQFSIGSAGNTYTGATYIESGRVQTAVSTAFGTGAGANVYVNGNTNGQAYLTGGTFANHFYLIGNGWNENTGIFGALRLQNATVSGQVTFLGNATISAQGGTGTISNVVDDGGNAYGLTVNGTGTLNLNNINTYSGGTTISAGTVSAGNDAAFGTGAVTFTPATSGTVANSTNVTLANNFASSGAAAGTFTSSGGTIVLNGNITGTAGLILNPTNKITLAGTNSFGTVASGAGELIVNAGGGGVDITGSTTVGTGNSSAFGGILALAGTTTVTVQSGGSLSMVGSTFATTPNSIIGQNAAGTSTFVVNGGSLTIGGNTGFVLGNNRNDANGVLTISSGTATINRGSTTATDNRSFIAMGKDLGNGTINLNGGTLATDRNFVRDGGSSTANGGTANFVFGGGTLKALANQTDWLNSATINTWQQALSSVTTTAVSTIDPNGFNVAINSAISGAGGFTINSTTGTGTVTFGGANTYGGGTAVQSGTLATSATGKLGTGDVTIGSATLNLGNASSIADSGTLFFVSTSGVVLNTGVNLEVLTSIVNTSTSTTLNAASFGVTNTYIYTASDLNSFFGGSVFSGDGTVAVPEPSGLAALGLASASLLSRRRRSPSPPTPSQAELKS